MNDRIELSWLSPRGPWHEADGFDRIYDAGEAWCLNRGGHPTPDRDYPDHHLHIPFDECQSTPATFVDAREGLAGPARQLEIYAARPFRFGVLRTSEDQFANIPRIVWDCFEDGSPDALHRLSLTVGEALRMARLLGQIVDQVAGLPC